MNNKDTYFLTLKCSECGEYDKLMIEEFYNLQESKTRHNKCPYNSCNSYKRYLVAVKKQLNQTL